MKIAVIRGGHSSEHEVSIMSGQTCIEALSSKHTVTDVVVAKDLRSWSIDNTSYAPAEGLDYIVDNCDVAIPMLHGYFGEDGIIQGALQTCNIPYIGSGVGASAAAIDKFVSGQLFSIHQGFKMPEFIFVKVDDVQKMESAIERLSYPVVCKPTNGGSSVGAAIVASFKELVQWIQSSDKYSSFIIQQYIEGTEVTCGVIEINNEIRALDVIEIIPPGNSFFDYDAKYSGKSQEILPARIKEEHTKLVQEQSVAAHRFLGCLDLSRSDFIIDKAGTVWLLEVNTMPGMTSESLVPKEIKAAGLELGEVLEKMCIQAIERVQ